MSTSKGLSSVVLGRIIGVSKKSAWKIGHAIRALMTSGNGNSLLLNGIVEIDEKYIGGKPRYKEGSRLMHNADKPVFLIWDGHPTHRSKIVKEHIESFDGKLEVYTLPPYSPELNPVEQVWNNVKHYGIGRKKVFGPDQLKSLVIGQLRRLQRLSSIVRAFYRHPECSYTLFDV